MRGLCRYPENQLFGLPSRNLTIDLILCWSTCKRWVGVIESIHLISDTSTPSSLYIGSRSERRFFVERPLLNGFSLSYTGSVRPSAAVAGYKLQVAKIGYLVFGTRYWLLGTVYITGCKLYVACCELFPLQFFTVFYKYFSGVLCLLFL